MWPQQVMTVQPKPVHATLDEINTAATAAQPDTDLVRRSALALLEKPETPPADQITLHYRVAWAADYPAPGCDRAQALQHLQSAYTIAVEHGTVEQRLHLAELLIGRLIGFGMRNRARSFLADVPALLGDEPDEVQALAAKELIEKMSAVLDGRVLAIC